MSNPIVNVNVSLRIAPTPATLQKQGAFVSQGATITSPGTKSLLTQSADLTPLLKGALSLTGITQSGGLATATAAAPHGYPVNDVIELTIAGANQAAYNGAQQCTITSTTQFTFLVPSGTTSPATGTMVFSPEDVSELVEMTTTFFGQGRAQAVSVLELGVGSAADGVGFLTAWIAANPKTFYSYLVPRYWDSDPTFLAMLGQFNATDALTYFFITTNLQNWKNYTAVMKCAVTMIECPDYGVWPANALSAISYAGEWGANVLTAIAWSAASGGAVTATTTTAHGVQPGQYFSISGCTPAGYNGTFLALPGTTGSTLIYALATNPGAETRTRHACGEHVRHGHRDDDDEPRSAAGADLQHRRLPAGRLQRDIRRARGHRHRHAGLRGSGCRRCRDPTRHASDEPVRVGRGRRWRVQPRGRLLGDAQL